MYFRTVFRVKSGLLRYLTDVQSLVMQIVYHEKVLHFQHCHYLHAGA
jgi:hypothetical protein